MRVQIDYDASMVDTALKQETALACARKFGHNVLLRIVVNRLFEISLGYTGEARERSNASEA